MAGLRLVLLRPQNAENVGAAARAMKNFGLCEWTWIDPAFEDLGPARRLAVHAGDLLDSARRAASLEEAVRDCVWVVGTSSRHREGKRRIAPREFAAQAVTRAREGTVALVFGDERSGMNNAEIDACQALSSVPTDDAQPSINLAQSVLLYCYELRLAGLDADPPPPAPQARPATVEDLSAIERALRTGLEASGFLIHDERHGVRDLVQTLARARLSQREARLWSAALHSFVKRR
jgi:TrmH family RNA methyltransferase